MASNVPPKVPFITLEEHWWSPAASASLTDEAIAEQGIPVEMVKMLQDISPKGVRLAAMDADGICLQIISHAPMAIHNPEPDQPNMTVDECQRSNDELAQRISGSEMSKRFKGFARLPMHEPHAAAAELRRTVTELGFVGSLVDNTLLTPAPATGSVFYDHPAYDALWQACSDLDVPFYLHPCYPAEGPTTPQYRFESGGKFPPFISKVLATAGYGWHVDTGLHFLRLVAAGVFDRFPRLKFVLGHLGESLPFFLERLIRIYRMVLPDLKRDLMTIWNENVWVAISGFFGQAPIAATVRVTKPERILFAVDWPFGSNERGVEYMNWLWGSGLVTPEQWEGIAFRNSLRLFGWDEKDLVRV